MLVQVVVYTFPADRADEAAKMLREMSELSVKEPGCIGFDVSRGVEDPNQFLLYEQWKDDAALDYHFNTEHFNRLGKNGFRTFAKDRIAYKTRPI
jgi:(4S)-4-hydroxy-5-phosphonooxypentane-2,3-dione isomerase